MVNCGALAFMSAGTRSAITGTTGDTATESVVTQQAQKELERQMQQQQAAELDSGYSVRVLTDESDTAGQ